MFLHYTAYRGAAQQGHREDELSENEGNFVKLLNLIGKSEETVSKKLKDNPRDAKYTHKETRLSR